MQTKAIKVEIDLTETIPDRYLGSSEDGPEYGPVTIIDAIVDAAATKLVADGDKALRKLVATAMEERVAALLDAELPGIFEKALNDPVEISDEWGGRKKSKTLSQIIGERARAQMNASTDRYGSNDTVMSKVVRDQVDHAIREILTAEVAAAKAHLKQRLQEKAAELLAAETLREAGIR